MSMDRKPDPIAGGLPDELRFERASAMRPPRENEHDHTHGEAPARKAAQAKAKTSAASEEGPPIRAPLRSLQEWFSTVMTHPAGLDAGIDAAAGTHAALDAARGDAVDRVVIGDERLGARDRLGIYHGAYRARLVECLADDYPAVRYALGEDAFTDVCHLYIAEHPSHGPSLNPYGQHMAEFLRTRASDVESVGDRGPVCADLAALEWALVEVVHAPAAPTLDLAFLQTIPPERWGRARLPPAETLRLVRGAYPVNEFYRAFRFDEEPDTLPGAEPSAVAVYRVGFVLWRMDLTPAMANLLAGLMNGETLETALSHVGDAVSTPEELAEAERNVMAWFSSWVTNSFFARVDLD